MGIGEVLREERIRQGLTLRQVAERAAITHPTVARVEAEGSNPTAATFMSILTALQARIVCSPDGFEIVSQ